MDEALKKINDTIDVQVLLTKSLSEWQAMLANDINVFSCEHGYLAKRFNEINFQFCASKEAQEIVRDNLYAILRYKYFLTRSDDIDERIERIVNSFCKNLSTTLPRITFDKNIADVEGLRYVQYLPDGCVAFSNGVYDFRNDCWFFKYDITRIPQTSNIMYMYDTRYIIQWYLNYHFETLPIDITKETAKSLVKSLKTIDKTYKLFAFELIYNMCHDIDHAFSEKMFIHMCEILGYCCLQNFAQYFVLIVGAGQNGKNSLFDGCFTNRLVPRPAAIDFDTIEHDRFATGSLANKSHNIFLETSAKKYTESKTIKALTGSMYQSIENKNEPRYSGIINCKYIFAGNDKDNIKFSDTTTGFIRRINMIDIFYTWDANKRFLKLGDYYDTTFSDSLKELKDDISNTTLFIYLAMFGIAHATKNFTSYFRFTENDWSTDYTDVNLDLRNSINNISVGKIMEFVSRSKENEKLFEESFFTTDTKQRIYNCDDAKFLGLVSAKDFVKNYNRNDLENSSTYYFFADHTLFVSFKFLQSLLGINNTPTRFTQDVKKAFFIDSTPFSYGNKPYLKMLITTKTQIIR